MCLAGSAMMFLLFCVPKKARAMADSLIAGGWRDEALIPLW